MVRHSPVGAGEPIRPFHNKPDGSCDAAAADQNLEEKLLAELQSSTADRTGSSGAQGKDGKSEEEEGTPAAQLVSELFESLKTKSGLINGLTVCFLDMFEC